MQDAGDAGAALASCEAALALDVHSAEAHLLLGALLCERNASSGDAVLAESHMTAGLQQQPRSQEGWCVIPSSVLSYRPKGGRMHGAGARVPAPAAACL